MKLYDGVFIDEFLGTHDTLLTHWHGDHTRGLNLKFKGTVHCSKLTSMLLQKRYPHAKTRVLETDQYYPDLDVVALDANHIPGSLMFYFPSLKMLYTGDYRVSNAMLNRLKKGLRDVETLYIDGTFHSAKLGKFLTRESSVQLLREFITAKAKDATIAFGIFHAGTCALLVELGIKFSIDEASICLSLQDTLRTMYPNNVVLHGNTRFKVVQPNKFIKKDNDDIVVIPCALWFCCQSNMNVARDRLVQDKNGNWRLNFTCHSDYYENMRLIETLGHPSAVRFINEANVDLVCL